MTGAVKPAAGATSTKRARKGRPEGFPRGAAATPRDAIPRFCAAADRLAARAASSSPEAPRRVILTSITVTALRHSILCLLAGVVWAQTPTGSAAVQEASA